MVVFEITSIYPPVLKIIHMFSKNLNVVYTEERNREEGYWSDTSSSSSDGDTPKQSKSRKKAHKVATEGPQKGESYGLYMKRKAKEEWEWATNPQSQQSDVQVPRSLAAEAVLQEHTLASVPPTPMSAPTPIPKDISINTAEKHHVPSGEFQRLLELLGSEKRKETQDDVVAVEPVPQSESIEAPVLKPAEKSVPTANDVKSMRMADSRRFEEERASEQRFSSAVEALEVLVVSQPFVQAVYKFLRSNHETFLSTKLRREVGEFSHADYDIYHNYVEKFEGVVLKTLAESCENFDEEEFFEKLFEPRVSLPGSEDSRSDPLSFEGWEVLLSILNFESFVDLMDDFIAASYGADELSNARSTKAAAKRGLPQKQAALEVQGEGIAPKPLINLRSKPLARKPPSSADSTVKPKRF